MLFGAGLVVLGVLAGALADRIRAGGVLIGRAHGRARKSANQPPDALPGNSAEVKMASDVIAALVQAGYSKAEASEATAGVASSACSTLESWTRAALKKLATRVG